MVPVGLVTSLVTGEVRSVLAFCAWSTLVASEVSDVGMQGVGSGMPGFIVEPSRGVLGRTPCRRGKAPTFKPCDILSLAP